MEKYKSIFEKELTTDKRNALPDSKFALPKERKYPIPDESHAKNALARVAANGTSSEISKVKSAVKSKFPDMEVKKENDMEAYKSVFKTPMNESYAGQHNMNTRDEELLTKIVRENGVGEVFRALYSIFENLESEIESGPDFEVIEDIVNENWELAIRAIYSAIKFYER